MTVRRLRGDQAGSRPSRPLLAVGPFSGRITAQSQTVNALYSSSRFVVPKGFKLEIEALVMSSLDTTGYTITGKLFEDANDRSGNFGLLQTQASLGTTADTARPTNATAYVIDATTAEKGLYFTLTSGAAGAGNANCACAIIGWLYEAA
ncbi:MAG: hypothetical protein FJ296_00715 [Planctomycetes bacterium]|nr:hypothetical protein [Planctomycetota bacterium]